MRTWNVIRAYKPARSQTTMLHQQRRPYILSDDFSRRGAPNERPCVLSEVFSRHLALLRAALTTRPFPPRAVVPRDQGLQEERLPRRFPDVLPLLVRRPWPDHPRQPRPAQLPRRGAVGGRRREEGDRALGSRGGETSERGGRPSQTLTCCMKH